MIASNGATIQTTFRQRGGPGAASSAFCCSAGKDASTEAVTPAGGADSVGETAFVDDPGSVGESAVVVAAASPDFTLKSRQFSNPRYCTSVFRVCVLGRLSYFTLPQMRFRVTWLIVTP